MTVEERIAALSAKGEQIAAERAVEAATLRMLPKTLEAVPDARVIFSNIKLKPDGTLLEMPKARISLSSRGRSRRVLEFLAGLEADGWTPAPSCWAAYDDWAGHVCPVALRNIPQIDGRYTLRETMPALPYWYELGNYENELCMFLDAPDGTLFRLGIQDQASNAVVCASRREEPGEWWYHSPKLRYHSYIRWGAKDCAGIAEATVRHLRASGHSISAQLVWKRLTEEPVSLAMFASWLKLADLPAKVECHR